MESYKQEFIEFMVESQVLKFGDFTLKSGRKSPFFMNAGAYVTGTQLRKLGEYYAKAIHDNFGLETMAGKGTEIGRTFEEIAEIINRVELKDHLGVCLDTCHVYDAGYDIVNDLDNVLEEFDKIIGLNRLKAIHLNDSKNPFKSHKDRHEKIGEGSLGLEGISRIINHPKLRHLPFFLETPNELEGYKNEIELLKEQYK